MEAQICRSGFSREHARVILTFAAKAAPTKENESFVSSLRGTKQSHSMISKDCHVAIAPRNDGENINYDSLVAKNYV